MIIIVQGICAWECKFNWSNNIPVSATDIHFENAIMKAIQSVENAVKIKSEQKTKTLNTVNLIEITDIHRLNIYIKYDLMQMMKMGIEKLKHCLEIPLECMMLIFPTKP